MGVPQPEEIYERTKEEGERRLARPLTELTATAIAAGFDVVTGLTIMTLIAAGLAARLGVDAAHVVASIGFGVAFVFIVVGRGELFTENFLVPIAGLDRRRRSSWAKLGELWVVSPIFNVVGGVVVILILTTHGVLPPGAGDGLVAAASKLHANHALALFLSAVFAGGLITAMTWFVEGSDSMGIRIVVAWIAGAFLALGGFDHVVVSTLELIFAIRFGAEIPWIFVLGNFGLAALGNMAGGIGLVTLTRFTQARSGGNTRSA